jgi:kynurenine formamidase
MVRFPLFLVPFTLLAQAPPATTKADVDRWMTEYSNWGRWGKEDQLGALNLITPEKRKAAARLVKEGVAVSLAHDTNKEKSAENPQPYSHTMIATGESPRGAFAVDSFSVTFHGYQHSHLDALSHMFWNGKMYNGYPQSDVTAQGAAKLGIANAYQGIFTRAVLIDLPWALGVEFLEPGQAIQPEDLEKWEKKSGVKIQPGDVLLFRTGRWARRTAKGGWDGAARNPGLHARCGGWVKKKDPAVVGTDVATDVLPSGVEGVTHPMHQMLLVAMGVHIFDNLDLEDVARECRKRNRWDFLITTAPIRLTGGTGSPLNPIAVF